MTSVSLRRGGVLLATALLSSSILGCSGPATGTPDVRVPGDGSTGGPTSGSTAGSAGGTADGSAGSAPDFELPSLDGTSVRLSEFRGKVVLIDFWSTTCDPCLAEMPHLVDLYKKHKDGGFVVLAISLDGPESRAQVSSVVHDKEMIFPVLVDEETSVVALYNPKREMPYSVIVGKNGSVVWKRAGYQPGSEAQITTEVEKALAK
jgi:peroxiredoxin